MNGPNKAQGINGPNRAQINPYPGGLLRKTSPQPLAPPTAGLSEGEPPTGGAAEAEKVEAITQSIMGELVREAVVDVVPQAAAPTVGQSLDESGTLSDFGVDYTESFDDLQ